jgi:hypothetical protein
VHRSPSLSKAASQNKGKNESKNRERACFLCQHKMIHPVEKCLLFAKQRKALHVRERAKNSLEAFTSTEPSFFFLVKKQPAYSYLGLAV